MIKTVAVGLLIAVALIGADRAAGTYWALPYAVGCVILVFGADRIMVWRDRATFAIQRRQRTRRVG